MDLGPTAPCQNSESRNVVEDVIVAHQRNIIMHRCCRNPEITGMELLGQSVTLSKTSNAKVGASSGDVVVAGRDCGRRNALLKLVNSRLPPVSLTRPKVQFCDGLDGDDELPADQKRHVALCQRDAAQCQPGSEHTRVDHDGSSSGGAHSSISWRKEVASLLVSSSRARSFAEAKGLTPFTNSARGVALKNHALVAGAARRSDCASSAIENPPR